MVNDDSSQTGAAKFAILLAVHREREHHVARYPIADVSRIDEQYPAADGWPSHVQRTTSCWNFIHSLIRPDRVEIPHDRAVGSGEGAQMPIDGPGENNTGNGADRG